MYLAIHKFTSIAREFLYNFFRAFYFFDDTDETDNQKQESLFRLYRYYGLYCWDCIARARSKISQNLTRKYPRYRSLASKRRTANFGNGYSTVWQNFSPFGAVISAEKKKKAVGAKTRAFQNRVHLGQTVNSCTRFGGL
jgi:hypothetical protein